MGQNFIPDTVNQTLLFAPSLHDWLPEGHLARFLLDVVSALDLSTIYTSYQEKDGRGQAGYAAVFRGWTGEAGPCVHRWNQDQGQRQQAQGDELQAHERDRGAPEAGDRCAA